MCLFAILRLWFLGHIGKLSAKDANKLFNDSKFKNHEGNRKEVTGVIFFKYLKRFLDRLNDDAINIACSNEKYDEIDGSRKGVVMKEVLKEVRRLLFDNINVRKDLNVILGMDSFGVPIEVQLQNVKMAKTALAKTFIYSLLKVPYKTNMEGIGDHLNNVLKSGQVKKHLEKVERGSGCLQLVARNDLNSTSSMQMSKILYMEIYLISELVKIVT